MRELIELRLGEICTEATQAEYAIVHAILKTISTAITKMTEGQWRPPSTPFFGANPITLNACHIDRELSYASHWATWKVDGLHANLIQVAESATKKRKRQSEAVGTTVHATRALRDIEPPAVFLVLRSTNGRILKVKKEGAVIITSNLRPCTLVLDGELALRRTYDSTSRSAYERERLRSLATYTAVGGGGGGGGDFSPSLYFVASDCMLFQRVVQATNDLQSRLLVARSLLDGTGTPADPSPVIYNYVRGSTQMPPPVEAQAASTVPLRVIYKPHQSPQQASSVIHDVPPRLVGFSFDGVILTPANAPFVPGTQRTLFKWKPLHMQTVDVCALIVKGKWELRSCMCRTAQMPCSHRALAVVDAPTIAPSGDNALRIVECTAAWHQREGRFVFDVVAMRADKTRPNAPPTIEGVLEAIRHPIPYARIVRTLATHAYR